MKILFLFLFFLPHFAGAQKTHTVQPKETLYSLARKYNVHPRELAEYNHIPVNTSLEIGQVIKIPSKTTMEPLPPANAHPVAKKSETKDTPKAAEEKEIAKGKYPMYHKVEKKETLYRISKMYANLTVEDIRKWNNLSGDALQEGMNLIVGYSNNPSEVPQKLDVPESQPVATEKAEATVVKEIPSPQKKEPVVVKKEEPVQAPIQNEAIAKGATFETVYNSSQNNRKAKEETGTSGIFKSTSGWNSGKYYCLSNTIPPGTIVKVTNQDNNKVIYARVLDLIPDLKQNADVILCLSNSGADQLGVTGNRFNCKINY